jgi:AcrR family transcriptional regulator
MRVSRAETTERLLASAISLGVRRGMGAMSLQGIAGAAGVSKALVLYHFDDKPAVLAAVVARLAARTATRMEGAATSGDGMEAWRALVRVELEMGELALLAALAQEPDARDARGAGRTAGGARSVREASATRLVTAIMTSLNLTPRVPAPFLGRALVRHLDGLAVASAPERLGTTELEAELDTFALALLAFGR